MVVVYVEHRKLAAALPPRAVYERAFDALSESLAKSLGNVEVIDCIYQRPVVVPIYRSQQPGRFAITMWSPDETPTLATRNEALRTARAAFDTVLNEAGYGEEVAPRLVKFSRQERVLWFK